MRGICAQCGDTFETSKPDCCDECMDEWNSDVWADVLAANLAIGAALCEAFEQGCVSRQWADRWWPGCGRAAPGRDK